MIRIGKATKLVNSSTGDVEIRMCLLRQKKYNAAESIFYVLILLKPRNVEVIQFSL